jgi:two-component sensor histidine kinase
MLRGAGIEEAILRDRSALAEFAWVLVGVALATGIRWIIDRGSNGVELATYFPAIVISAIFLKWPFAVLSAVLSLAVARLLFMDNYPLVIQGPRLALLLVFVLAFGSIIVMGQALRWRVAELRRQQELSKEINSELQHRIGNILQITMALASRAMRADDPKAQGQNLLARLEAMAGANKLLGATQHNRGNISEIILTALAPFPIERFDLNGPACEIGGDVGIVATMALHELATNAMKYGALSNDDGRVALEWLCHEDSVEIRWNESGGPLVEEPARRGLGSRILSPHGPLKKSELRFEPCGVLCVLWFET